MEREALEKAASFSDAQPIAIQSQLCRSREPGMRATTCHLARSNDDLLEDVALRLSRSIILALEKRSRVNETCSFS